MTHDPSATSGVVTSLALVLHMELKPLGAELNELLAGRTKSAMPATLTKLQSVCLFAGLWGIGIYLGALRDLTDQVLALNAKESNKADLAERHRVLAYGLNTLSAYLKDLAAGTTVSYLHLNQAFGKLVRRARPELLEADAKQVEQLLFMAAPPTLEIVGSFTIAKGASRTKLAAAIATASISLEPEDLQALAQANPYLSLSGYMEAIAALVDEAASLDGAHYRELSERLLADLGRLREELVLGEPLTPPVCDPHLFSSLMAAIASLKAPQPMAAAIRAKYGLVDAAHAGAVNDRARTFVEGLDKAIDGLSQAAKRNVLRSAQTDALELSRHADQLPSPAFKTFALQLRDHTEGWKATPPAEADWVQAMGLLLLMRACAQTWGNEGAQSYLADYAATMDRAAGARLDQCQTLQEASANAALVKLFKLMSQEADLLAAEMDGPLKLMHASQDPASDAASVVAGAAGMLARRAGKLAGLFTWIGLPTAAGAANALAGQVLLGDAWADADARKRIVLRLSELRVLLTRLRPTSMLDLELPEDAGVELEAVNAVVPRAHDVASVVDRPATSPEQGPPNEPMAIDVVQLEEVRGLQSAEPVELPSEHDPVPAAVFGADWGQAAPDWASMEGGEAAADPLDLSEPGDMAPEKVAAVVEDPLAADLFPAEVIEAFRAGDAGHTEGPPLDHADEILDALSDEPEVPAEKLDDLDPVAELRQNLARVDAEFADRLHGSESLLTVLFEEVDTCVSAIATCISEIRGGEQEERVSEIRRRIHTLKGASRTCKLDATGFILHELETYLDLLPDDNQVLAPNMDTVQTVFDDARRRLEAAKAEFQGIGEAATPTPAAAIDPATAPAALRVDLPAGVQAGAPTERHPPAQLPRLAAAQDPTAMVRIPVTLASTVGQTSGTLLVASQDSIARMDQLQRLMVSVSQMVERIGPISRDLQGLARSAGVGASSNAGGFDALELDRSTALQDAVQQLAEAAEDMRSHADSLTEALRGAATGQRHLAGMAVELQRQSSELLLVPVESHRNLLVSMVDLACQDTGKKVELVINHAARMPAGVVDRLSNVIGHILRNAVAHGIEAPAMRLAAGKPEKGTITLGTPRSGAIKGGFVQLAIRDDGAGIDLNRVFAKAVERGLIGPGVHLEELPGDKVRDLIFAKGFSTAEQVTQLAGRGVGLDVVRSYMKTIGGEVFAVEPPEGGTEFVLTLPVDAASMAVIPVLASGYRCLVPSSLVARIVPASAAGIAIDWEQGRVDAAGHVFPLRDLRRHVPGGEAQAAPRGGYLLFMRDGATMQAVYTDAVERQQRVITKSLGPVVRDIPGFVAATFADTTGLTLVLNPVDLPAPRAQRGNSADSRGDGEAQRTVMVVDDSTTVQKASRLFLEALGYNVISAGHGKQALDMLATADRLPDVILSDIEMPVMNGFDLLSALKRSTRTRAVPVVIISSRTSERHQTQAMDLGAVKYMMKPFDEFEVRRFLEALFAFPETSSAQAVA